MTDEPLTLWHASRADMDRPTIAGRTEGDHHANSGLGIYCATGPHSYISGFGDDVHALVMRDDARVMDLTVKDLRKMGEVGERENDRAWFEVEGRRLARDFDVIMIRESSGYSSQAIILNDDAVASSRRMDVAAFRTIAHSVDRDIRAYEKRMHEAYDSVRPKGPSVMGGMPMRQRSRSR